MLSFLQGTLLISNILLILLAIIYGFLIIKKKKQEESNIWIYFIIASALFFLSEIVSFFKEFYELNLGLFSSVLQIFYGIIILLAFITKYSSVQKKKK
jgi:hypothetical protein